jgi:hypothetical protein
MARIAAPRPSNVSDGFIDALPSDYLRINK